MAFGQLEHRRPVGLTRHREHNITGQIMFVVVISHLLRGQRTDALCRSEHRVTERMAGEVSLHHVVVGNGRRLVGIHADLFQDHLFFHVKIILTQRRVQDARLDLERLRQILGQRRREKDGAFFRRGGVIVGSDFVEDAIDVFTRKPVSSLKRHVFQEVTDTRQLGRFIACAGFDVEPKRDTMHVGIDLGDNFQAVV